MALVSSIPFNSDRISWNPLNPERENSILLHGHFRLDLVDLNDF